MPDAPRFKNKKRESGATHEVAIAVLIVAVLAIPFVAIYLPRFLALERNAIAEFLRVWRWIIAPIMLTLDAILFVTLMSIIFAVWPIRYFAPGPFARERRRARGKAAEKDPEIARRFASLKERLTVPTAENLRLAVIEGDALVDSFLKRAGYEGEHMADRLSQLSSSEVPALERLWNAHRLRNTIVHTPGAAVSPREARAAMKAYEDFLKELGAL